MRTSLNNDLFSQRKKMPIKMTLSIGETAAGPSKPRSSSIVGGRRLSGALSNQTNAEELFSKTLVLKRDRATSKPK